MIVFAAVGYPAWGGERNRPALVGLVCGILAILGVVAFWLSVPIIFGGLAVTLGVEGMRRAPYLHRGRLASAAVVLGSLSVVAGGALWLAGV